MSDCNCKCIGAFSSKGAKGDKGDTGADGVQSLFGGFSGEWIFDTSTSTGPTSTLLRFDSATYSAVTQIYISDTGVGSVDYDAFLDSFNNSGAYGLIKIFKKSDSTKFWMGKITTVVDNGIDHTLQVTYITSNSTFSALDELVLTFSANGLNNTAFVETSIAIPLTITTPTQVTSIAPGAGTYLAMAEGLLTMLDTSVVHYRIYVDGSPVGVDRVITNTTGVTVQVPFSINRKVTAVTNVRLYMYYLTAGATLEVVSLSLLTTV